MKFYYFKTLKYLNDQDKLPKSASILRGVPINKFAIFFIEV